MKRLATRPATIPRDLDWPATAARVCRATGALRRLRVGLSRTVAGGLVGQFEGVTHNLGLLRVVLAARGPAGLDLGDGEDPPEFFVPAIAQRRPIPSDQWSVLSADAEALRAHLLALAATPGLDPRLVARLDRAVEDHRALWVKVIALVESAEPAEFARPTVPAAFRTNRGRRKRG